MIAQRYRTHLKKECPAINQCVATAKTTDSMFIVTGDIEHNVTLYDEHLELVQQIPFKGWIRCCDVYDIDNNGNHEIAIGSGDNSVRVFRYNTDERTYSELWRFNFSNKVTTISIGDVNYDGRAEVIAGGWDNSLKVFDGLTGVLLWELDFDDWVTLVKILDVNHDGLPEVVVGLKKGQLGIINGITGECLWDYQFEKRINACDLVHLANNPFPHLLVGGDDNNLYLFDINGSLIHKIETPDRILCISHGDINNDNYAEVLLTLADKRLYVYETVDTGIPENVLLKIRWKATLPNVGTGLTMSDQFKDSVPRIIVTGYSKDVRILEDFFCGMDEQMENSSHLPAKLSNHKKKLQELLGSNVDLEFYDQDDTFFFPKTIENLNQLIPSNFQTKSESYTFMNIKEIFENKFLLERQMEKIREENLPTPKPLVIFPPYIYNLIQIHAYSDEIEQFIGKKLLVESAASSEDKAAPTIETEGTLNNREKFISIMQSAGTVSSKAKLQTLMEDHGFNADEFEKIFTLLKETEGIVQYSRSTPRGYSVIVPDSVLEVPPSEPIGIVTQESTTREEPPPVIEPNTLGLLNENFLNLIKEHQPVSSKAKLVELANSINLDDKTAETLIEQLKELGILEYSRSSPRGWFIP